MSHESTIHPKFAIIKNCENWRGKPVIVENLLEKPPNKASEAGHLTRPRKERLSHMKYPDNWTSWWHSAFLLLKVSSDAGHLKGWKSRVVGSILRLAEDLASTSLIVLFKGGSSLSLYGTLATTQSNDQAVSESVRNLRTPWTWGALKQLGYFHIGSEDCRVAMLNHGHVALQITATDFNEDLLCPCRQETCPYFFYAFN